MKIAITGASGQLGHLVIERLRARLPASDIVALVRTLSKATDLGVELRAADYTRPDTLELPSYLMVPPLLEATDHLAVVPGQLADAFIADGRLAALDLPLSLPNSTIRMHWHRRFHEDPGNAWLRGVVAAELGG